MESRSRGYSHRDARFLHARSRITADAQASPGPHDLAKRLQGKRVCVCLGAGGVGKTTTSAALGVRPGRARGEGRGRDDRPGAQAGRRARASASSRASRAGSTPQLLAAQGVAEPGELWAMALDVKRTFDDVIARLAPDEALARGDPRQPRLPRAVLGGLRRAGARRGDEAVRAVNRTRLRRDRARHATLAQRARLPESPREHAALPRRPRAEGVPRARAASPRASSAAARARVRDLRARDRRGHARRAVDLLQIAVGRDRRLRRAHPRRRRAAARPRRRAS